MKTSHKEMISKTHLSVKRERHKMRDIISKLCWEWLHNPEEAEKWFKIKMFIFNKIYKIFKKQKLEES